METKNIKALTVKTLIYNSLNECVLTLGVRVAAYLAVVQGTGRQASENQARTFPSGNARRLIDAQP